MSMEVQHLAGLQIMVENRCAVKWTEPVRPSSVGRKTFGGVISGDLNSLTLC